jgi:hypothetical protein
MNKPTCSFDGCKNPSRARGWCPGHYGQWRRGAKLAPLKPSTPDAGTIEEQFARKVIKRDGCWGWNGGLMHGYGRVRVDGKNIVAHRVSYEMAYGPIGEGMMIDHICHTRECTRPDHLREVTPQQNSQHMVGKNPNNTSGRHGVSWRKDIKKWHAMVHYLHKGYHAGYYDDLDEAAEAARLKRLELFTHNDKDRRAA